MRSAVDEQPGAPSPELSGRRRLKPRRYPGDAEEFHAGTLSDVSRSGICKTEGVGDVFAGRVDFGIV